MHTLAYDPAIKRNELSSHKKTRMNLKCILLSETSQSEKAAFYIISIMLHSEKGKLQA